MKITLHRPIYIDAEHGVRVGNFDLDDERRARQLIDRGYAGEGYDAKAKAGAPRNRAIQHTASGLIGAAEPGTGAARIVSTRDLRLKPVPTAETAQAARQQPAARTAATTPPANKRAAKKATKRATKRGR